METTPYYTRHVFFCCNLRDQDRPCCGRNGGAELRDYAKQRLKHAPEASALNVRINNSGCLGRCDEGPVIAVYPEGVWYTYIDQSDIDEIIDEHILKNRIVDRLRI